MTPCSSRIISVHAQTQYRTRVCLCGRGMARIGPPSGSSTPLATCMCSLFLMAQSHTIHHMSVSVDRICLGLVGFADVGDWQSGVLCGCRHVCCKCDGYGTVSMDITDGSWRGTATKNSISVRPRKKNECHHCLGMACTNHSPPSIVRRWMSDTVTPSPSCSIARICPR